MADDVGEVEAGEKFYCHCGRSYAYFRGLKRHQESGCSKKRKLEESDQSVVTILPVDKSEEYEKIIEDISSSSCQFVRYFLVLYIHDNLAPESFYNNLDFFLKPSKSCFICTVSLYYHHYLALATFLVFSFLLVCFNSWYSAVLHSDLFVLKDFLLNASPGVQQV